MDEESRARARIDQDNLYLAMAEHIVEVVATPSRRHRDAAENVAAYLTTQIGYPDPDRVLTLPEAGYLAAVINCTQGDRKVGRMVGGHAYVGEARYFGTQAGGFLYSPQVDVRDLYLHVVLDTGEQVSWLVSELMDDYLRGYFVPGYETPAVL